MISNKILPCYWYEKEALDAMKFYSNLFPNSTYKEVNGFLSLASIDGCQLWGINGGPMYRPNPTLSLYTICTSREEIDIVYEKILEAGGKVLMHLDKYDWSDRYAWIEDKWGVSWQLTLQDIDHTGQRITPALMYVGDQFGKAEEAIHFLVDAFPSSKIHFLQRYEDEAQSGKIAHGQFDLFGQRFIGQESGFMQSFSFTEGGSLVILCNNQSEIDRYWNTLTEKGEIGHCGWCKDQYGFSWQVIPENLHELMADPVKSQKVAACFRTMKKMDYEKILTTANS